MNYKILRINQSPKTLATSGLSW